MKKLIVILVIISIFMVACTSEVQQPQQQQPYVDGGCGVAGTQYDNSMKDIPIRRMM